MRHIAARRQLLVVPPRALGPRPRIAYGDIYHVPDDLGRFDVSFFGCILLHLRDPLGALQQAAEHTDTAIVVTDNVYAGLEDPEVPVARFAMDHEPGPSVRWWDLSPGAVTRMLWRLGFDRTRLVHHTQRFMVPDPPADIQLFTVVAERPGSARAAAAWGGRSTGSAGPDPASPRRPAPAPSARRRPGPPRPPRRRRFRPAARATTSRPRPRARPASERSATSERVPYSPPIGDQDVGGPHDQPVAQLAEAGGHRYPDPRVGLAPGRRPGGSRPSGPRPRPLPGRPPP